MFVSDAPGNWDRPFRHHFIVILSSSPVINVSCLSTFGVVAPNQRIIQLNYRPSLVMAIHGEINTIKYGIKLEKSVFVREATLLPALSPHLSVLQPPPMVNIVVANHESVCYCREQVVVSLQMDDHANYIVVVSLFLVGCSHFAVCGDVETV